MSYFYEQESAAFKACVESLKKQNKKVAVIGHVRPDGVLDRLLQWCES